MPSRLLLPAQSPLQIAEQIRIRCFDPLLEEVPAPRTGEDILSPGDIAPVILSIGGQPFLREMHWGFVPYWSSSERATERASASVCAEKAAEQLAYRESFRRRRCLVPARAFAPEKSLSPKLRHEWMHKGPEMKLYAALWDSWSPAQGGRYLSFALLTRKDEDGHLSGIELSDIESQAQWLAAQSQTPQLQAVLKLESPQKLKRIRSMPAAKRASASKTAPSLFESFTSADSFHEGRRGEKTKKAG